jgi:hypothetical protein
MGDPRRVMVGGFNNYYSRFFEHYGLCIIMMTSSRHRFDTSHVLRLSQLTQRVPGCCTRVITSYIVGAGYVLAQRRTT